ncbi:hypothetical protein EI546_12720 [Aequorivita sp. H23M31]|uniref:DUF6973 domain-containing protein n=1 Tax=Aequorivita ciconiae TaxID=2494375 RepID=A0A410G5G2_9FLAO|nr:hypothetical protein [Aequorivita sp. H23M31]QAA82528.1 hypothetical protein EI546_12720 [Aequorivita sp. H23M31]
MGLDNGNGVVPWVAAMNAQLNLTQAELGILEDYPELMDLFGQYFAASGNDADYGLIRSLINSVAINNSYQAVEFVFDLINFLIDTNYIVPEYTDINFPGKTDGMPFNWWNNSVWINNNIRINGLKPEEKPNAQEFILFALFPREAVFHIKNSMNALNTAQQLILDGTFTRIHNGKADAFRHTFWNALDASDFGVPITLLFTTAHETGAIVPNHPLEMEMDLHNNSIGAGIGAIYNTLTPSTIIKSVVINAMQNTSQILYLDPLANHDGENILPNSTLKSTNQ